MVVAALVAAVVVAQATEYRARDNRTRVSARAGGRNAGAVPPTYLEFLPTSGAGLPVAENLCDALTAEAATWNTASVKPSTQSAEDWSSGITYGYGESEHAAVYGNHVWACAESTCTAGDAGVPAAPEWVDLGAANRSWCVGGDGQEVAGSELDFQPDGGTTAMTVCPSGPDCAQKTALVTGAGANSTAKVATASGTGAMTACWYGSTSKSSEKILISQATAYSAAGISWAIEHLEGVNVRTYISNGSTVLSSNFVGPLFGGPSLLCLSHGGGSSPSRGYWDGTAATPSAAGTRQSITAKATIDGINGAVYLAGGTSTLGAFYVDQQLSAAQIAAIARRVLADSPKAIINGSTPLAATYARAGTKFCSKSDNTGSLIPAGRACIARNAYLAEAAATNLAVRSQEFGTTWAAFGVGVAAAVVTDNYGLAPDGTKTADRVQIAACPVNGDRSAVSQSFTAVSAATYTNSLYVKGVSGSGSIGIVNYSSAESSGTYAACAFTDSAWSRCAVTKTYTSVTGGFGLGCYQYTPFIPGSANTGAADVLVWAGQAELGPVATSYIPTTSAAASRGYDLLYFDLGAGAGPGADLFSFAATAVTSNHTGNTAQFLRASAFQTDNSGKGIWLYSSGAGAYRWLAGNDAAATSVTSALGLSAGLRVAGWQDGAALRGLFGATVLTPGIAPSGTYTRSRWVDVGNAQGYTLGGFSGFIGQVCLDSRPSRCR